ncbi:MAG: HAD family phosphatase [Phycisphaerae bacterium]|nr:HAD family phosphatase [Phycisphaerae bacterium]
MDALIFDFDGVIADSEPIHYLGFADVLAEMGIELAKKEYVEKYLGFDDHDGFRAIMSDRGLPCTEEQLAQWTAAKTRVVQQHLGNSVQPIPGTLEMIRAAAAANMPLAIYSGSLRKEVELATKALGVWDCFAVIVAAEDVENGKPHPEGYRKACKQLGQACNRQLDPAGCVVCEDSPVGTASAKAAGMNVCALATSYHHGELAAADRVVDNLSGMTLADLEALAGG